MDVRRLRILAAILLLLIDSLGFADEEKKSAGDDEPYLALRLVDEAGKPVADAEAGIVALLKDYDSRTGGKWDFIHGVKSDSEGFVRFRTGAERFKSQPQIYARHAARQLVGLRNFDGKEPEENAELTMHAECHVSLPLRSSHLEQRGRIIVRPVGFVGHTTKLHLLSYPGSDSTVHAFLPPGEFEVFCHTANCSAMSKTIAIQPGERRLELGPLDLPAKRLVLLEGNPAPELSGIMEWKNGPAVKLSDLRGKVVLLEFWGWWCGPCVNRGIPELLKIQDDFRGKDLVIIGIHTPNGEADEIDSVKKLDARLAQTREKAWKGQDITFPVAMTRYQKGSHFPGGPEIESSQLCIEYGVDAWPTTVLIDKAGCIAGSFYATYDDERARLKELLSSLLR
jgi:thiol-disulfide isomerase/thioredoxin